MDFFAQQPGLDPGAVGRSLFGRPALVVPEVPGYVRLEFLASGGFGQVWKAHRRDEGQPGAVALKVPHQSSPEFSARIETEAASLQALDHPAIVKLLDVTATQEGLPVLVMELVDGVALNTLLPRGGFSYGRAMEIFLPVLEAVAHAHARGIVHRDLKPGNILIPAQGGPKVTDFGLAASLPGQQVNFTLTRSGVIAGTVEYLAPERYEAAHEAGTAVDIYALGVILYELLTGRPPRGAWQAPSILKRLDVRLDALILQAIHADPLKRVPSAAEFRERLEEILETRKRYAGSPLVTRRVQATDAVWTVLGWYALAAAFCAQVRINNTSVPAVFDLGFGHTYMLGGFWALWVLTPLMGALGLWLAVRLWRFRSIPLREALPAPLGWHAGRSRGAAVVAGVTQVACFWAPLFYMGLVWSQVWHWADAGTPPWHRVLAITRWGSEVPVSMWTWEPGGFFSGDEFWIREMQPGYPEKTWMLHDRQSFLVVTQPLVMVLGAVGILIGLAATALAVIREWRGNRPWLLAVLGLAGAAAGYRLQKEVMLILSGQEGRLRATDNLENTLRNTRLRFAWPKAKALFEALHAGGVKGLPLTADDPAPEVTLTGGVKLSGAAFFELLQRRQAERGTGVFHTEAIRSLEIPRLAGESGARFRCVHFFETAAGAGGAVQTTTFRTRGMPGPGWLAGWEEEEIPLYRVDPGTALTDLPVETWLARLAAALQAQDPARLTEMCLSGVLFPDPEAPEFDVLVPAVRLAKSLQIPAAAAELVIKPGTVTKLPGFRTGLHFTLEYGTSRPGSGYVELVPAGGEWRILRIRLGDEKGENF